MGAGGRGGGGKGWGVGGLKQIANLLVYMSPAPGKNDRFCY